MDSSWKSAGLAARARMPSFGRVFWTISAILLGLWAMGMLSGASTGLWIHLFLTFSVISLVLAVASGLPRAPPGRGERQDGLNGELG